MRYLLDTHVVVWWLIDPKQITSKARHIISDKKQTVFLSSVSFWEMAIKQSIGRLQMPANILSTLISEGFNLLPLTAEESLTVAYLPSHHNDPFDRLIVAQAYLESMVPGTQDRLMRP